MSKDDTVRIKKHTGSPEAPGLGVRIEYVGVIAIACLFLGAIIGASLGHPGRGTQPSAGHDGVSQSSPEARTTDSLQAELARIQEETDHQTLVSIGNKAYDENRAEVAIHAYEKALTYQPNDPDVLTDLAAMYLRVEQPQRAVELTRRAATLDARHVQSRFWLGEALAAMGDSAGARKAFEQARALAPGSDIAKHAGERLQDLGRK